MSFTFTAPRKDPAATLDYQMDWSAVLADGETITAQTVTSITGITISGVSQASGIVRWRVAGGTSGTSYPITVQITTSAGQIDQRTVQLPVRDR